MLKMCTSSSELQEGKEGRREGGRKKEGDEKKGGWMRIRITGGRGKEV